MDRYLVIQLARFGDLVQTKRLVKSLELLPKAEVHLAVDISLQNLAAQLYPRSVIHGVPAHAGSNTTVSAVVEHIRDFGDICRGLDFRCVFNLNFSGLNFALAALFPPEIIRGYKYKDGQRLVDHWAGMAFRWTKDRRRAGLNLMDFWAGYAPVPAPAVEVNPPARAGGQGVGLVLAGRHARRSLPMEVLSNLTQALLVGQKAKSLVLLGSKGERPLAREFLNHFAPGAKVDIVNLVGKTDWLGLINALTGLDALLTPDTGTMHLAAHLGVPVTALFLSSAWCFETGPYGHGHRVLQASTPCTPCLESQGCDHGMLCLSPFSHPRILSWLRGEPSPRWVEGLTVYGSIVDDVGVNYQVMHGDDEDAVFRQATRDVVTQTFHPTTALSATGQSLVEQWSLERDWMIEPV